MPASTTTKSATNGGEALITATNTITIYNAALSDDRRKIFYPTVIEGVAWHEAAAVAGNTGVQSKAYRFAVRIPVNASTSGKRYVSAEVYKKAEDRSAMWTIQNGDAVVLGAVADNAPVSDPITVMQKSGIKVFVITEYADNTQRGTPAVQHWRIGGV